MQHLLYDIKIKVDKTRFFIYGRLFAVTATVTIHEQHIFGVKQIVEGARSSFIQITADLLTERHPMPRVTSLPVPCKQPSLQMPREVFRASPFKLSGPGTPAGVPS